MPGSISDSYKGPDGGLVVPKARGIGRVADNPKALLLFFDKRPTDEEMRAIHDALLDAHDLTR